MTNESLMLDHDSPNCERLTVAEAVAVCMDALDRLGYEPDDARIITDHLVDSALCGYTFAGLPRILAIASNRKSQEGRQRIQVVFETPASSLIDGGNNVGYLAAHRGAMAAIEKAKFCGLSAVGVYNSYYSGRAAYYVEKIVNAGLIAIHASSAQPKVIPPGGAEPILGTNPICFGFPSRSGPMIFDAGTAAIMGGELTVHALLGEALPAGVAFDAQGRPTRDPKEALKGGVAPFAGHKGFGLSLAVQALGLLAGAALARGTVRDYGFFFLAIDPAIMGPQQSFQDQLTRLIDEIKSSRKQPGVDDIRIPFERAQRERTRRREEGIVIDCKIMSEIRALGARAA